MPQTEVDMDAALEAVRGGSSFAQFLGFSPNLGKAAYACAVDEYQKGQYEAAIKSVGLVVMLDARNADAWSLMGNALLREGEFQAALDAWRAAMGLRPTHDLAAMVARTAVALKNPEAVTEAVLVLVKHLTTPERVIELGTFCEAMCAMTQTPAAAGPGDHRE